MALPSTLLRWSLVRRLRAEARALGHAKLVESFAHLAREAAELEASAPPSVHVAGTGGWLSLAATAVAAYRRMLRAGRPPSTSRSILGAALGSLTERYVGAYLRSRFSGDRHRIERVLVEFFAWCCTKELLPLFRELMPESPASRKLGRLGDGRLASWRPGESHPPPGGMSASGHFR